MGQVYTPAGPYRMNYGTIDMARNRVANRFGLAGMVGVEDPRGIPARGPTVVLPLVRGREGWFYLSDGKRAQDRGIRGLGDAASDYAAIAAQLPVGSTLQTLFQNCAANPGAPQCASATANALATPYFTQSQQAQINAAIASGGPIPVMQGYVGAPPGTSLPSGADVTAAQSQGYYTVQGDYIPPQQSQIAAPVMTPQEAATAVTGKPNQSVPPTDTSTPMPTGTGAAGGNAVLNAGGGAAPPPSSNGGLILLGVVAALFLLGRH